MLLARLAETSADVAATSARSRKVELLAAALHDAAPEEVETTVAFLSGELRQRRTGVGWATLRDLPLPAERATLTVAEVDTAFRDIAQVSGPGAVSTRRVLLEKLFGAATAPEQAFLSGLARGELRQGALESLVVDALARAAGLPAPDVRRAVMLRGSPGPVAAAVLESGADAAAAVRAFHLEVGRPVQPMLAQSAPTVAEALGRVGRAAVEWKLDGIRVQIHRDGSDVGVFTRTLDDVTDRLPEIVDAVRALPLRSAVLDGEAIAVHPDGRPRPFQVTGSRVGSRIDLERARRETPLTLYVFDALHLDGADLLSLPAAVRHQALASVAPSGLLVPRLVTDDNEIAAAFLDEALGRGHEGVLVKAVDARYDAGRRGAAWVKVKPVHTLDLVVLAAEWGSGRRRGWLSNLHLGARDPSTGGFVMLGKTFKGLTDEMLRWQTERLLALAIDRSDWVVTVRPELVVEVAFDGVQTSSRYPGGMALRFARVVRHRPDKSAEQADTVDDVRALHRR
ncbi:MAG TPA: ATP-dependent DNA ligase [Actinomycetes bacterium]|nr:ATP-dependent DNA ligase [Actinomycetes bacterium]